MSNPLISFSAAARLCPEPLHPNAIWRWGRRGLMTRGGRRIHLKLYRVGGRLYTTERDLFAFFEAVAQADQEHFAEPVSTPRLATAGSRTVHHRADVAPAASNRVAKEGI